MDSASGLAFMCHCLKVKQGAEWGKINAREGQQGIVHKGSRNPDSVLFPNSSNRTRKCEATVASAECHFGSVPFLLLFSARVSGAAARIIQQKRTKVVH